jgi:hypothetical protein
MYLGQKRVESTLILSGCVFRTQSRGVNSEGFVPFKAATYPCIFVEYEYTFKRRITCCCWLQLLLLLLLLLLLFIIIIIIIISFLGSTAQLRPWPPPQNPAEFLGGFSTIFFFTG